MRLVFARIHCLVACVAAVVFTALVHAQSAAPTTQMVRVNGRSMRVSTTGLDRRLPGEAVVILEAGAGAGLDEWAPAVPHPASLAPTIAYDRHGIGQSETDTERRTIRRVAATLHELLHAMHVAPPYLLVGHSWGGVLIRGFAELYGPEVAGLVYIETMDAETTRQELADALPDAERKSAFDPPEIPPFPPDLSAGLRAEYEDIKENMLSDFAEARSLRPVTGVPVSVVIAAPPGRLKHPGEVQLRLQIKHQGDWALNSSNGLLIVSGAVKHDVAEDDPALVVQAVRHVLNHRPDAAPKQPGP